MITKNNSENTANKSHIHRPQYHYLPQSNWMNDPNGVIQWDGKYHLFYQYNPYGANHANMHWGHAVSENLTHWEELPIAISPTPDSPDRGGIFSGCIVNHNGIPTAFYTGVNEDYTIQVQCSAIGSPDLSTWEKVDANPVIGTVPPEMGQTKDFRDPFVWQDADGWYMAVGCRIEGVGGAVLLYRSKNLRDWEYLNPLFIGENARNGVMFECPNFFKLGDKWVLIISSHIGHTTGTVLYFVGDYVNHKFIPEAEGVLDSGYYYAPLSYVDDKERRILWAWIREGRSTEQQLDVGWSGVQAIPRIVTLDSQNRLNMSPVPEFEQLRGQHFHASADSISEASLPIAGLSLDIEVAFRVGTDTNCGIQVTCSPDGREKTSIYYNAPTQTLRIQREYSKVNTEQDTAIQGLPHALDSDEDLELRILLDGSVLEVIANHRTSITSRIYPTDSENQQIRIISPSSLKSLDIWEVSSIWM